MIQQETGRTQGTYGTSKLLNQSLVNGLFHIPEYETVFVRYLLRLRNSTSKAMDRALHMAERDIVKFVSCHHHRDLTQYRPQPLRSDLARAG